MGHVGDVRPWERAAAEDTIGEDDHDHDHDDQGRRIVTPEDVARDAETEGVVRTVDMGSGRRVDVRHTTAHDLDALVALYERLSPDDRELRFFQSHPPLRAVTMRWLSQPDSGGVVLVAELREPGATPAVIAEAGYSLLPDGDGELAITVDPDWRGWLGPWLLDTLAEQAAERGVANLHADVLLRNRKMLALLRHRGSAAVEHQGWEQIRLVISSTGHTPGWPDRREGHRLLAVSPGARWAGEKAAGSKGVELRTCPGPGGPLPRCPALDGRACPLVEGADALVVTLPVDDPTMAAVIAEQRRRHPDLTIVLPDRTAGSPLHPCESAALVVDQVLAALDRAHAPGDRVADEAAPGETGGDHAGREGTAGEAAIETDDAGADQ